MVRDENPGKTGKGQKGNWFFSLSRFSPVLRFPRLSRPNACLLINFFLLIIPAFALSPLFANPPTDFGAETSKSNGVF